MTTLKFEIKFTPSYDRRGEKPNYGQHPLVMFFVLTGEAGAIVMELNTGWYLSEIDSWSRPFDMDFPKCKVPYVAEVYLHRHLTEADMQLDASEIHDDCGWLDGANCVTERIVGLIDGAEWMKTLVAAGAVGVEAKMREFYWTRFPDERSS